MALNSVPYKQLEKIAKILNKPVSYFFDGQNTQNETIEYTKSDNIPPIDMLAFSLTPNANKQEAIKEAKSIMKKWYIQNNMKKSTKKDFNTWWEGK